MEPLTVSSNFCIHNWLVSKWYKNGDEDIVARELICVSCLERKEI